MYITAESLKVKVDIIFESEKEAIKKLHELQDYYYGEFSYRRSQEIANGIETNQFAIEEYRFIGGSLEEIAESPEKYLPKIRLTNACHDKENGFITENEFNMELFHIKDMHKEFKGIAS